VTLAPWDPGLQNERTGLAWQRTMLAGLTCSLLVARLLATISLTLSVIIGLLALLCTAGLGWIAIRRFRMNDAAIREKGSVGDGKASGLVSLLVVLTAFGALLYVALA
jgi:uncharacterized membrane protein YidH (DUF202 family)